MAENNLNKSWNPLNYSQNLCVNKIVSNNGSVTSTFNDISGEGYVRNGVTEGFSVDSFSSLDFAFNGNHEINQLVNDLISNNKSDLRFDYNQSLIKNQSINPFIADNMSLNDRKSVFDCGDFRSDSRNMNEVSSLTANGMKTNGFNALIGGQNTYNNPNSFQMITIPEVMSSLTYNEIKSFSQPIRSSNQFIQPLNSRVSEQQNNLLMNGFSNPMTNSLSDSIKKILPPNHSITHSIDNPIVTQINSGFCRPNSNQSMVNSLMASKSVTLPYNQKTTLPTITPQMESPTQLSAEVNQFNGRQMRSIRARNATQTLVEPINKLNYYLEKSYEQFKHLEKERKKIECELIEAFVGHKISSANNIPIQKLPQNASKVDRIITDMSREHAKVITIVAKMEQLKGQELTELIHNSIHKWYEVIRDLQMKRKIENQRNATNIGAIGLPEESFIDQFSEIMRQLLSSIRAVRTCLWCALVITLYDQTLY